MRRKNNPFVSLAALVLLVVILTLTCTGCVAETDAAERDTGRAEIAAPTEETETTEAEIEPIATTRFKVERGGSGWPHLGAIYLITDNETGVQYLAVTHSNGVGLTKLED